MTDQLVYALYVAANWAWWVPSVLLFFMAAWGLSYIRRRIQILYFVAGAAALGLFSISAELPGNVIAILGRPGSATIVRIESAPQDRYDIVVHGQDGEVHAVLFDFHHNDTNWAPASPYTMLYFQVGDQFNVRYLGGHRSTSSLS